MIKSSKYGHSNKQNVSKKQTNKRILLQKMYINNSKKLVISFQHNKKSSFEHQFNKSFLFYISFIIDLSFITFLALIH